VRIGVVLRNSGTDAAQAVRRLAELAAELQFDSVWVSDHVVAPEDFGARYGEEWLDPFVSLAIAAEHAPGLGCGFSVLVLPYRPALPTARALASLQSLCGERVVAGVGSGWLESEFEALGADFAGRGATTDQRVDEIHAVLAGERPDFVTSAPPVPLLAAGNSPRNLARAARLDGWHPIGRPPAFIADRAAELPAGHRVALRTRLGWQRERKDRPLFGTPAEIADDLSAYAVAGVTDLVVDHAADALDDIERDLRELAKLIGDTGARPE
jgi:alkanesulfonate monooxygenase SsuD/methylene tetrahydromethanopterin reductase-like flavin-dependent oxidoreductase (luciferase family)